MITSMRRLPHIFLTIGLVLLSSCTREVDAIVEDVPGQYDPVVRFDVETYQGGAATKTEYSGEIVGSPEYERINWTYGQDRIRVISDKGVTKGGATTADYTVEANRNADVSGVTTGRRTSEGEASPVNTGEELYWKTSGADHFFFALYPSPDATDADVTEFKTTDDGKKAIISGTVPAVQTYKSLDHVTTADPSANPEVFNAWEYKPVMTNAYMYASSRVAGKDVGVKKVPLRFKPLFNAYRVKLYAFDSDAEKYKVTKISLSSADAPAGSDLAGDFTTTVDVGTGGSTGDFVRPTSDANPRFRTVSLSIDESDQKLIGKDTLVFTLLALPLDQTDLTLHVDFVDMADPAKPVAMSRRMDVKNTTTGVWYTLAASHKLNIMARIPSIEYVFEVQQRVFDEFEWENEETKQNYYTVISYRKIYNRVTGDYEYQPWPWKAVKASYDNIQGQPIPNWVDLKDNAPGAAGSGKSGPGRVPDPTDPVFPAGEVLYAATMIPNLGNNDVWYTSAELGNATATTAINLGNYNFQTGKAYEGYDLYNNTATPYETANCYVVSGPGWYKIPLVYGNGFHWGEVNAGAYSNSIGGTGGGLLGPKFYRTSGNRPKVWRWNPSTARYEQVTQDVDDLSDIFNNWSSWRESGNQNKQITAPWITRSSAQNGMNMSHFRYPKLVWQDVQNMVTVPSVSESVEGSNLDRANYLYFKVDESALSNLSGGNAVVAVCNSAGTIVWSWHIWVVPKNKTYSQKVYYWADPNSNQDSWSSLQTQLRHNEMLNRNVGYVGGKEPRYCLVEFEQESSGKTGQIHLIQKGDPSTASACHYQWGRKDPMWSVSGDTGKTIYLANGDSKNSLTDFKVTDEEVYYGYTWNDGMNLIFFSIEFPDTFIQTENLRYVWCMANYENLWDNSIISQSLSESDHYDHNVVKTVYDPCPPGFKVPNEFAFTGFNKVAMDGLVDATVIDSDGNVDPTLVINGLRSSFNIGYTDPANPATSPVESEGMWLYCHPTDPSKGVIFFPCLGRRRSFDGGGDPAGYIQNPYSEGLYWTNAPFKGMGDYMQARVFEMRRVSDGSSTSDYPQCIPVRTSFAAPNNTPNPAYMRSHALQVRPVRDMPPVGVSFTLPGLPDGRNPNIDYRDLVSGGTNTIYL